jgi:hypothetical protein
LIHALDAKERRYFRLFAQRAGGGLDKNYLQIYDFLLGQPAWSEADLRAAFPDAAFARQLHVACTYLYEKLLAALCAYDADKYYALALNRRLDEINLLFERRLYGSCLRHVRKTLRYAARMDLPQLRYQLLHWELRLLRMQGSRANWQRMADATAEADRALAAIGQEHALHALYSRVYAALTWAPTAIPLPQAEVLQAVAADPLLAQDPARLCFDAALIHHSILGYLALARGDKRAFAQANLRKRAHWERNAARMRVEQTRYFRSLVGFVESAVEVELFREAADAIARMERLCRDNKALRKSESFLLLHLKLRLYLNMPDLDAARSCLAEFPAHLPAPGAKAPKHFVEACVNAAHVHFLCGRWSECLAYLAKAEPPTKRGAPLEFTMKAGPTRLMALYAAHDLDQLDRALHHWQREAGDTAIGRVLTAAFRNLVAATSDTAEQAALLALQAALADIPLEAGQRQLLHHWAQARIEGRPLRTYYPPRTGQP